MPSGLKYGQLLFYLKHKYKNELYNAPYEYPEVYNNKLPYEFKPKLSNMYLNE